MVLMQADSVDALGELYDRFRGRAYRVAWSVCHDDGRAEDALQEAFLSIWRSRASYRSQNGSVAAWLLTVVRHRAIDVARRNDKHAAQGPIDDLAGALRAADDVAAQAAGRDCAHHVQALLAGLPEAQREVIALAFYGELSHREIAEQLGLPAGTVKGRMRLGLDKLRAELQSGALA